MSEINRSDSLSSSSSSPRSSSSTNAKAEQITSLGKSLIKEVVENSGDPCPDRCLDLIGSIHNLTSCKSTSSRSTKSSKTEIIMTIALLERTMIGKNFTKSIKAFRRHKRTTSTDHQSAQWDKCIERAQRMLSSWKDAVAAERQRHAEASKRSVSTSSPTSSTSSSSSSSELPTSTGDYRSRLTQQKKEMYKDPPVLPPPKIIIDSNITAPPPKRNPKTMELRFEPSSSSNDNNNEETANKIIFEFRPNRTPKEILLSGSFGGTYFRPITSAVTNQRYQSSKVLQDTLQPEWVESLSPTQIKTMLTSCSYNPSINKYKVKCGGSLGMWESSGWISDVDPYGWFQWYCRFYSGRRCSDDARQIGRWLKCAGPKGRFRSQLCNKILKAADSGVGAAGGKGLEKVVGDVKISPVIRQTLLHWGLEISLDVLQKHQKRVGGGR